MGGCRLTFAANSSAERFGGDVEGDELQAATVLDVGAALGALRRRCSRSVHTKRRNGCLQRASIGRAHVHQVLWGDLAAEAEVFAKLTTLLLARLVGARRERHGKKQSRRLDRCHVGVNGV